jgi:hypothetical protein
MSATNVEQNGDSKFGSHRSITQGDETMVHVPRALSESKSQSGAVRLPIARLACR